MKVLVNRLAKTADDLICAVEVNGRLQYYGLQPAAFTFEGTFPLTRYFSPAHGFNVPLINDVPGHEDIEIHIVNTVADTRGCLGIADNIVSLEFIANSAAAVHEFYAAFFAAVDAGEESSITFKNVFQ